MKHPISIILLLFCIQLCKSQTDTIFINEKVFIPCKIMNVTLGTIEYSDSKNSAATVNVDQIKYYSVNGTRITGNYSREVSPVIKGTNDDLKAEINYMKKCLRRGHQEYNNGLVAATFGILVTSAGLVIKNDGNDTADVVIGLGSVVTFIGAVLMIDSHKWQNRAGLGISAKSNGVALSYQFK